jgi:hypothetical protein
MATVTLGNIKFNWKGAYNSSTAYVVDDVVSLSGSSYICIQAGTNQNPASASAYWEQMSSAGTNGTDVGTTITTQGDILYRDGSGLQRLGAGTSGQYLETKGSGQNPVWSSVSAGELQFISTHSLTGSNVADWNFDNVLDNTNYDHYKINVYNLSHNSTTNTDTYLSLRASGSTITPNIYAGRIRNNPTSNGFTTETVTNNYMRFEHTGTSGSNGESTGNYEIILYNASCKRSDGTANTHRPMANCRFVSDFNNSTQVQQGHSVGIWNTTTPVDGFSLKRTGYDILGSTIKPKVDIYGYVKQ